MKTLSIPHPENPSHVANLASVSLMKAQGFTGTDANLSISLFEYRTAWRTLPDGQLMMVYECRPGRFDRTTFSPDLDPKREWNWVRWPEVSQWCGMTAPEFLALPLPDLIFSLVGYYGTEEIFGTTYWEGFGIADE